MHIQYDNTFADQARFAFFHQFFSPLLQGLVLVFIAAIFSSESATHGVWRGFVSAASVYFVLWIAQTLLLAAVLYSRRNPSVVGDHRLELRETGVYEETAHNRMESYWSGIARVVQRPGFVALYITPHHAHVIPNRCFESLAQRHAFLQLVHEKMAEAHAKSPEPAASSPHPVAGLRIALRQGVRAACFLSAAPPNLVAPLPVLLGLWAVGIGAQWGADFILFGLPGEFSPGGLPAALFPFPLLLLSAWALAGLAARPERALPLAVLFAATAIPLILVEHLAQIAVVQTRLGRAADWIGPLWLSLSCWLATLRAFDLGPRQRGRITAVVLAFVALPLVGVGRDPTLWVGEAEETQANPATTSNWQRFYSEDIFYLQPVLLERTLASLKPGPKERTQLYFVGVAGYSSQDVFMKEVRYVEHLLDQRYDTTGHSVLLVNNAQTLADLPIASSTALQRTLKRIGEVMDRDRDILFLYLSSHGSHNHKFSLQLSAMRFNDLDPSRLRTILDASGIKRRVVVISACYAGGFINALKNDDTLVIAAAASDKQSFGCSNEADFTYFGKAYFAEALQKTDSFVEAFELARPAIALREDQDRYEHADPRMFVGADIERALATLRRRDSPAAGGDAAR